MQRKLIVTHHAPDLDAIGSTWLLKKFDSQHYADAKIAFVNPGDRISEDEAHQLGFSLEQATHVDTGLGKFDHHQPERAHQFLSASSVVFGYLCQIHPELSDDQALKELVNYITEIDHFREIDWPDAGNIRYNFMIQEILRGLEFVQYHDDQSLLNFGFTCLEGAYIALKYDLGAKETIEKDGIFFTIPQGKCMGIETRNDETIKVAQKQGIDLVIRKDPQAHHIRIKVRPDSSIELKPLHNAIQEKDQTGTWYYHPSGKMLINGSRKHHNQTPSPLSLDQVIQMVKEVYS